MRDNEKRWHIGELEALAIVWAVEHFKEFLWTAPHTTVNTDHRNLKWIWNLTTNKRIVRWALQLQEYNITIVYRQAKKQVHVDMLTRNLDLETDHIEEEAQWLKTDMSAPLASTLMADNETIPLTPTDRKYFPSIEDIKNECNKPSVKKVVNGLKLRYENELYFSKNYKIYVPLTLRPAILRTYHSSLAAGHQAVGKMSRKIQQLFFWPHLKQGVAKHVQNCLVCT